MEDELVANNPIDNFLINTGPTQDCLVRICSYLNVTDLLVLCDFSQHTELFTEFLNDRVIPTKLIDFTKIIEYEEKVFQYFGRRMRKMKGRFTIVKLIEFLRNVIQYCEPGQIIELELHTDHDERHRNVVIGDDLLDQIRPFVHRLEQLKLKNGGVNDQFRRFFDILRYSSPFMNSLKLNYFDYAQFSSNELSNITKICTSDSALTNNINTLERLLNRITNLQVFVCFRSRMEIERVVAIADLLFEHFPNLNGFGCFIAQSREERCKISDRLKCLRKFEHLTELHLSGTIEAGQCDCVPKLIEYVPNIKLLSLCRLKLDCRAPIRIRHIAQSIKQVINGRRNEMPHKDRVQILVNDAQYREFQALNIDCFISLEIMTKMHNYKFPYLNYFAIQLKQN